MPRIFGYVSLWALAAFVLLLALQWFPPTGIFLMMLGGGLVAGLLVHVFLIALGTEALTGKLPRIFVLVPVVAYGAYYVAYAQQGAELAHRAAELRAANPGKVLAFDPARDALVSDRADELVRRYAIPVAYQKTARDEIPEGYMAWRLVPRSQCAVARDPQARVQIRGVTGRAASGWPTLDRNVCLLGAPEIPKGRIVTVSSVETRERGGKRIDMLTTVAAGGKTLGRFQSESDRRLPLLPFGYVGCALIDQPPAWSCTAEFVSSLKALETTPDAIDKTRFDSPESVMLGLRKYADDELNGFGGYAGNRAAIMRVAGERARVDDALFDTLKEIVAGEDIRPPWGMAFGITRHPDRLAPLTEGMAARLEQLSMADFVRDVTRADEARLLAIALASVPDVDFAKVAPRMQALVARVPRSWELFPSLYVRSGDAGPADVYVKDLFAKEVTPIARHEPMLAICRAGRADPATIAELERIYLELRDNDFSQCKTAAFVTLLKLGQRDFLVKNTDLGWALFNKHQWQDAVLRGDGRTKAGPNNCMPKAWDGILGAPMQPSLKNGRMGSWTPAP